MKEIYIIGASGFGREVAWLINELNEWIIKGFIDDDENLQNQAINEIPVIGNIFSLVGIEEEINVIIAIANPIIRKKIVNKLSLNNNIKFPNIVSKDAKLSNFVEMGVGNIICAASILTTNITLGDFNHINLSCTIGHDVILSDYVTIYPSVNVSGAVNIGDCCELGTGTQIIQGKNICPNAVIGAGSVVVKDISESGTYVGVPAKKRIK